MLFSPERLRVNGYGLQDTEYTNAGGTGGGMLISLNGLTTSMNYYKCTITGKQYSESTIKANLSAAYREHYLFEPSGSCDGCLVADGVCSAHIIAKARLKVLKLTSLIWSPELFFRSCYTCNQCVENVSSLEILELKNFDRIEQVLFKYDKEFYAKLPRRTT